MNIEGFSEKTAELLFDNINIKSISDLYRIKKEQLLTLPKFGDKKADNLINAIEKVKLFISVFCIFIRDPKRGT